MMRHGSVSRRLTIGLALVGLVGTALLFLFVALEYGLTWSAFLDPDRAPSIWFEMREHVVIPVFVVIVPMTLAARWVIRRALAPLQTAAAQVDAAPGMARGFRIDPSGLPIEAVPFAHAVNGLLERLDRAAADQEGFAADVAHELRTPLTVMALEAERLDPAPAAAMKRDIAHMRRLIDQLMLLAQLDADVAARTPAAPVPLASLAGDVASRLAPLAIAAGRAIAVEALGEPIVAGRREAIAAALRNLIENALRVTPEGGTVTIIVGPGATLAVRDEGTGLSTEHLALLKHRHGRGDHASADGAGLGLAIVNRIMIAHGGTLDTLPDHRELQLLFPAAS